MMASRETVPGLQAQPPPHAVEAEKAILGSMICDAVHAVPIARAAVTGDCFFVPAHQTIFQRATELFEDKGTFELVMLTQHIRDLGQLDAVGGPVYLTSLFTGNYPISCLPHYLGIVKEKHLLREVIKASTETIKQAYDNQHDAEGIFRAIADRSDHLATLGMRITRLPDLRDMAQMMGANKPHPPAELVEGILHQGSKLVVGGTSKGRKTFALIDLAISVATGTNWWGFHCQRGSVCYINFEIQESFFCGRTEIICERKGVTLAPGTLLGWNLRGHGEGIEHLIKELMMVLRTKEFVLIIIDPIYKALGNRDENKAGDVASMLNELEKIAVLTGSAIAFGAHYSKGNQAAKESIDRIGGSGVFGRDSDSILTMTPHEEEDAFSVEGTLRNFAPIDPFVVRWDWPLFRRDEDLDPTHLKKRIASGGGRVLKDKADLLALVPLTGTVSKNGLQSSAQEVGIAEKRFRGLLSQLLDGRQLFVHRRPRRGTNLEILISRNEQDLLEPRV